MNSKIATYITLALIMALGIGYWRSAMFYKGSAELNTLGPGYFPALLAIILIILCVINFIQTLLKKENERIEFPRLKLILLTVATIILLFISWYYLGYFYINLFVFLLILFTAYRFNEFNWTLFIKNGVLSLVTTILIFIIFEILLNVYISNFNIYM